MSEIELRDLKLLAESESPDLADAIIAFLSQPDPVRSAPAAAGPSAPPSKSRASDDEDDDDYDDDGDGDDDEDFEEDEDEGAEAAPSAAAATGGPLNINGYKALIDRRALRYKSKAERREAAQAALKQLLSQEAPPPRLLLAELIAGLYDKGTPWGRATILRLAEEAPLRFGLWGGLKRVYKRAEERMDAEVFGALACRFDTALARSSGRDVGNGTLIYLRRRAWRFLRHLGTQVPALYPQFAVQVLRHYGPDVRFYSSWIVPRMWPGVFLLDSNRKKPQDPLKNRPFDEAWKRSPDPLMLLLETCRCDAAAAFAIASLRRDFPETLRKVTPAWLERLAHRPLASAHEFLIDTLQASPELHQVKLRGLGLHEAVLALLTSPSGRARTYAIEYARAHAQDLAKERLEELLQGGEKEVRAFAAALLATRPPRELGLPLLGRLLGHRETAAMAEKALATFERKDLSEAFLRDMLFGESEQLEWAQKYLKASYAPGELDAAFWKRLLDDPRSKDADDAAELAVEALGKLPLVALGAAWLLDALMRDGLSNTISKWLARGEGLGAADVATLVERVKGLVLHSRYRHLALPILENGKLIRPKDLGLPWLLSLARRAQPELAEFAHRYLLQHMGPADFSDDGSLEGGTARLFALATSDKEPEPVRLFAQTYLRCHHPSLSSEQPEAKSLHLKPQLKRAAYTAERIWPSLFDPRPDVRRFAAAVTRVELRRWGYHLRVYELADSDAKEVRNIAYDALLKAGDPTADTAHTLKPEELEAGSIFALAGSRKRSTREVALELIRRHYGRLGGAERLPWLMESPDREVRLFAVRLLWEKHRPLHLPPGWKPSGKAPVLGAAAAAATERFPDIEGLRGFLRRILFGLPPGRSMEPRDPTTPRRHVAASVAKRYVIEIVRDLGEEDEAFARLVAPVLAEFTGSLARTEWQACLAALMRLQKVHPALAAEAAVEGSPGEGRESREIR
ncbi:MAG: hypothetical protein U1A78_22890 [Polyangia bacterium]